MTEFGNYHPCVPHLAECSEKKKNRYFPHKMAGFPRGIFRAKGGKMPGVRVHPMNTTPIFHSDWRKNKQAGAFTSAAVEKVGRKPAPLNWKELTFGWSTD
ncbi:hypothetical protein AVEN_231297-1 [Araneus ventricosus]|uniref:Uncharacterized protein n=1 Tax=Araneus ventricosus TaxID=182803 RepID=A0A4Y2CHC3_ARAVE|nr:hypothetical protein AVEN_231297-1 [Araneus ventricosus]